MLIAIDGPSGVGKSTVARAVAADTGLAHLDTGSTYRAATVVVIDAEVDPSHADSVDTAVAAVEIELDDGRVYLDGSDVTDRLRSEEVTSSVSAVAAHPGLRRRIVEIQRAWVADRGGSAVVEGRDIGTVVFPDAPVKIFLTARADVRAARRSGDTEAAGKAVADIADDLARRDRIDSTREASPLRPAEDAHVIDTSDSTVEEVVSAVLDLVDAEERSGRYEHGG